MHQAIRPAGLARNDADILADLADLAGHRDAFTEGRDEAAWLRAIYREFATRAARSGLAVPDFDEFWETGHMELPEPQARSVLFAGFRDNPDRAPLATPSGRIEIVSERLGGFGLPDMPAHPAWLPPREWLGAPDALPGSLHLLTMQPAHRLHSQGDTGPMAQSAKIAGREPILLNPSDAATRGITHGDCVVVENARGALFASARISAGLIEGVVMIATGAWFDPDEAAGCPERHGNQNVLTRDVGCSELTQAPSAKSVLVTVRRHAGAAPAVMIHHPPEILRDAMA
jgi:biotin/methionine sulfoxide reductase